MMGESAEKVCMGVPEPAGRKVAIVTGASSGLGADIAEKLAEKGYDLVLSGRNKEGLQGTGKNCRTLNATVKGFFRNIFLVCSKTGRSFTKVLEVAGEVREEEVQKRLVSAAEEGLGRLDLLVNCAGIVIPGSPVPGLHLDDFDTTMDVNVRAVVSLTLLALPHLISSKGNIINVSSVSGIKAEKNRTFYCMSKAALDMFTKCLALDLARHGVRVNCVNPGAVETAIHSRRDSEGTRDGGTGEFYKWSAEKNPMGRNGEAAEVAEAVCFLASEASSWTTGQLLGVDGGAGL